MARLKGRCVVAGDARGVTLVSREPIGFFGHVDPETGRLTEPEHPLDGECLAGRVLVFPHAKGSTVGSYVLYALSKRGKAPAALLLEECETIVAVGAILGGIPTVDRLDLDRIPDGVRVEVSGGEIRLEEGA